VELHGAHGYLIAQFLSPGVNTRIDEWGGSSLVNRARFHRTLMQRVRAEMTDDFVVGERLSPEGSSDSLPGWDMDLEEIVTVAAWLVEDHCDFLSVSMWGNSATMKSHKKQGDRYIYIYVLFSSLLSSPLLSSLLQVTQGAGRPVHITVDSIILPPNVPNVTNNHNKHDNHSKANNFNKSTNPG
jgi:hypothetical protein